MAWKEIKVVEQRKSFIKAYQEKVNSVSGLCRQFKISRKTGYKWIHRFETDGFGGLEDLSRAPHVQGRAVDNDLVEVIISVRCAYPTFGPKKVLAFLNKHYPRVDWPSANGIGNILDRAGLVNERKYRRRVPWTPCPPPNPVECNDTWCADFKGWFLTGDGNKCEPFTLTDLHSRFLISCVCLGRNDESCVWECLDASFKKYGLPNNFKSDNGSPFASTGVRRLSRLSVKLIKAGINPIFIEPGKPQQNGRHERMHQTLKKECATPPSSTLEEQIAELAAFHEFYNYERPHQSLGQVAPGSIYRPSTREWNGIFKSPEYNDDCVVRKVGSCGNIKLQQRATFVGEALAGELIALRAEDDGVIAVYYGPLLLGHLDKDNKLIKLKKPETN